MWCEGGGGVEGYPEVVEWGRCGATDCHSSGRGVSEMGEDGKFGYVDVEF